MVVAATLAVFLAVLLLARGASSRDMALLFGGLEPEAAGEVITALDQRGAIYEIRGPAIYVATAQRDSLRMLLAGEGLPASGVQGYELLDNLSGFGTTSQMFDAAYWRAKEGELARTIAASPHIRSARVHISPAAQRGFSQKSPATAAVTISTSGGTLMQRQVQALQYLVGAAVPGLDPTTVAIVDDSGGLISEGTASPLSEAGDARAATLRERAERLLAARVGPGNAVVEVSLDTIDEIERISERSFDPNSRVAISTDISEVANKSQNTGGGNVTVASNLPDGDAASDSSSNSETSETRSLTNYEVNETQREVTRSAGGVRRLTVAVLVNETVTNVDDAGNITTSIRGQEELDALESLIASAVGVDLSRGDEITLRSLPFDATAPVPLMDIAATSAPLNLMSLIQIGVLAAVALILGLFVVRPILTSGPVAALAPPDNAFLDSENAKIIGNDQPASLPNSDNTSDAFPALAAADPVTRLQEMIAEREVETIQILQDWMDEPIDNGTQL